MQKRGYDYVFVTKWKVSERVEVLKYVNSNNSEILAMHIFHVFKNVYVRTLINVWNYEHVNMHLWIKDTIFIGPCPFQNSVFMNRDGIPAIFLHHYLWTAVDTQRSNHLCDTYFVKNYYEKLEVLETISVKKNKGGIWVVLEIGFNKWGVFYRNKHKQCYFYCLLEFKRTKYS